MLQVISGLRILFSPYLPFSSQKLHGYLGFEDNVNQERWQQREVPSSKAPIPTPLFPKLDLPVTVWNLRQ